MVVLAVKVVVKAPQGGGKSTLRNDLIEAGWVCSEEELLYEEQTDNTIGVAFTATKALPA